MDSFRSAAAGRAPLAFAFLFVAASVAAQTHVQALDEVIVTATRSQQRLADVLPSATAIDRRDIEQSQSSGLVELLGRQAGVEFARAGGPGTQASLFLRGTNSSQTLVLIDGVRLNTALGGAAVLGGVTLDSIERIEIVRGNLSSLYGSEAVGGVIQIFTRAGERSGVEVGAEAGSGSTWSGNALLSRRFDGGSIALAGGTRRSAPFSAIDTTQVVAGPFAPGANADIDGNRNWNASLNARGQLGGVDLAASVWANRNQTDFDSTADGPEATHLETSTQQAMQASAAFSPRKGLRLQVALARSDDDSRNASSNPLSFNNSEFDADNRSAALSAHWQPAAGVEVTAAYEHLRQQGASTSYDPDFGGQLTGFSRRVNSLRAGFAGAIGRHRFQGNVRHDDYSDFGGATTGLAAYGFDLDARWRLSAQWSNAFRAPSFNDLYFPFFGNPELQPEKSSSGELALRYGDAQSSVRLAVYRTRVRDLIVYDPAAGRAGNVARAEIDGAELIASAAVAGWRLQADVGATHAIDADSGQRLPRRAPYKLHFAASRAFGPLEALFEIVWNDRRYDSDINTFARTTLDAYSLARVAASWRLSEAVRLTLRLENLFDADYELVDGYSTAGRSVFAGVQVRL